MGNIWYRGTIKYLQYLSGEHPNTESFQVYDKKETRHQSFLIAFKIMHNHISEIISVDHLNVQ